MERDPRPAATMTRPPMARAAATRERLPNSSSICAPGCARSPNFSMARTIGPPTARVATVARAMRKKASRNCAGLAKKLRFHEFQK